MTEAEKRAHVIADNRLSLNAGLDEEMLAQELQRLIAMEDVGFDIGVMGFGVAQIDSLVEDLTPEEPGNPDDDLASEIAPRRVSQGDVWLWARIAWFAATRLTFGRMFSKGLRL